jgi:cell division protein FtsW
MAYLDPWNDPRGSGFQIIQSFLAFANGSIFGTGLGNGNEKLFYLPEAHNDFIFSVIGEELGFIGVLFVVILFVGMTMYGLKLSMNIKSQSESIFASGAIVSISFQAFLNMAVVLGLLPTKGLTLPLMSYGGSSLVSNLLLMGLFFSCIRFSYKDHHDENNGL